MIQQLNFHSSSIQNLDLNASGMHKITYILCGKPRASVFKFVQHLNKMQGVIIRKRKNRMSKRSGCVGDPWCLFAIFWEGILAQQSLLQALMTLKSKLHPQLHYYWASNTY